MGYVPHWRATFKGSFRASGAGEGYEQWNTSIAFNYGLNQFAGVGQEKAEDLRDDFIALMAAMPGFFASNTYLDEVRLDSIGADGKIDQDAVFAPVAGGGQAGGAPAVLPPSCAVVLTLDTKTRGRSRFGRMYLPLLATPVTDAGVMSESNAQFILGACRTFVNNVSNSPGLDAGFGAAVASGVGSGSLDPIQEIRIGRVIDTMRSRRRSMDESYVTGTVTV